ncbi:MAG: hypothetical protein Q4E03_05515 [Trueperella sp.]|nr:hypothetical protein [Trueperella sp.]
MENLNSFAEKNFAELDRVMPIVQKVHGPHHGEIFDVAKIYDAIKGKISAGDGDLDPEFTQLKTVTDDYTVPGDVCETFEKVYHTLAELNQIYESK